MAEFEKKVPKKVGSAAKSPRTLNTNLHKKGKSQSSTQIMAVTSYVGKASPQLQAEFRQLWNANKAKVKKVICEGPLTVMIYN